MHWVLRLVILYDLLGALGSASCDITDETGGAFCYGHWILRLVISQMRQGVRVVTGIGFCEFGYLTADRGYDLSRALDSAFCDITHETGRKYDLLRALGSASCEITYEAGGTRRYDLLRALGSVCCDIAHETGPTSSSGDWVLWL